MKSRNPLLSTPITIALKLCILQTESLSIFRMGHISLTRCSTYSGVCFHGGFFEYEITPLSNQTSLYTRTPGSKNAH